MKTFVAFAMTLVLLVTTSMASTPRIVITSVSIANTEMGTRRATAAKYKALGKQLQTWADVSRANGSLGEMESAILKNKAAFIAGKKLDASAVSTTLMQSGLQTTEATLQAAVESTTQAQRATLVKSIESQGLYNYLNQSVAKLNQIADGGMNADEGGGSCGGWVDWGNDLMSLGVLVTITTGQAEAGAVAAGVGAVFYFYGRYACA